MASPSILALLCLVSQLFISECLPVKSVTYPGIGTFTTEDFFDILNRPIVLLPQSPQHIDPVFSLYTRSNILREQRLLFNDTESIKSSHFDGTRDTKIIVHGFIDNYDFAPWMAAMKNQWLDHDQLNVIVVDWSKGNGLPYGQATANTRVVGPMIAIMIDTLSKVKNTSPGSFHIIGHSLGSHIAGYAGKFLKGSLGHITGLDPAGPYFENLPHQARLWPTDAHFVEAVHTDARRLIPNLGFGMLETCAHVDIYPNGGQIQPGCNQERVTSVVIHGIAEGARRLVACNHQRAIDFYTASIYHQVLPRAFLCEDYDTFQAGHCTECGANGEKCIVLGPQTVQYKTHIKALGESGKRFFLKTDSKSPYFKHQLVIRIKMAPHSTIFTDKHGKIKLKLQEHSGNTESFDFFSEDEILRAGHSYSQLFVLQTDPSKLEHIIFQWSHGLLGVIFKSELYIESIEVVNLSTSQDSRTSVSSLFCHHAGVVNDRSVSFTKCS